MNILQHPAINEPTLANLRQLLAAQDAEAVELKRELMPAEQFLPDDAVAQIEQARAWWPRKCAEKLTWDIAFAGSLALRSTAANTDPLLVHLGHAAQRVVVWLQEQGRATTNPNEERGDRLRRLNRERVARHRANTTQADRPASSVAWDAVLAALANRRAAIAKHDAIVKAHYDAMTEAAAHRAEVKAEHDALVAEAEEAHRLAKTNVGNDHD